MADVIANDEPITINSLFVQITARAVHLRGISSSSSREQVMAVIGTKNATKEKRRRKRTRIRTRTRTRIRTRVARPAAGATRKQMHHFSRGTTVQQLQQQQRPRRRCYPHLPRPRHSQRERSRPLKILTYCPRSQSRNKTKVEVEATGTSATTKMATPTTIARPPVSKGCPLRTCNE